MGGKVLISHLAYADDIIIFTNASTYALEVFRAVFELYQLASGMVINMAKSAYYPARKINNERCQLITNTIGIPKGSFPFTYLGAPLYIGKCKSELYDEATNRMTKRIAGWEQKLLTFGGRITLINSVLNSTPSYLLQFLFPTKKIIKRINVILNKFFWGFRQDQFTILWCNWSMVCKLFQTFGYNMRDLESTIFVNKCKLWWKLREKTSLWAKYMSSKYLRNIHPTMCKPKPTYSRLWNLVLEVRSEAEKCLTWKLGSGQLSFWGDNWSGLGSLADLAEMPIPGGRVCLVAQYWNGLTWNFPPSVAGVVELAAPHIQSFILNQGMVDMPIWLGDEGKFKYKKTWNHFFDLRPIAGRKLWINIMPPNVNVFIWRLYNNFIHSDINFKSRGFSLASKCGFCDKEETTRHLFMDCSFFLNMWDKIPLGFRTIHNGDLDIQQWLIMEHQKWKLDKGVHLFIVFIYYLCYQIWEARNKTKYVNSSIQPAVCLKIVCFKVIRLLVAHPARFNETMDQALFRAWLESQR